MKRRRPNGKPGSKNRSPSQRKPESNGQADYRSWGVQFGFDEWFVEEPVCQSLATGHALQKVANSLVLRECHLILVIGPGSFYRRDCDRRGPRSLLGRLKAKRLPTIATDVTLSHSPRLFSNRNRLTEWNRLPHPKT